MNDFERKLRQQPFRTPPPDLRAAIFGAEAKVITPEPWTWRDWLWPSPAAWGALAAVWVACAAVAFTSREPAMPDRPLAHEPTAGLTLLTFHRARDFDHVLKLPN